LGRKPGAAQGVIGATGVDAGGPSQARANLGVRHRFQLKHPAAVAYPPRVRGRRAC